MSKGIAVVTGSARGIGLSIAERLLADGFRVVISDISQELIDETLESHQGDITGYPCNVSDEDSVKEFFSWLQKTEGGLNVLVNNAGITRDGLLMRMKPDQWDAVLNVNLRGTYLCCQAAVRPMMKNPDGGRVINIASVVGVMGNAGQANYAASKAGVIGLSKSMAKELASRQILVNAIAPGFIQTAMTDALSDEVRAAATSQIPLGRFGTPGDVAGMCSFLAGPDSSYITGQVFLVDGGMVM